LWILLNCTNATSSDVKTISARDKLGTNMNDLPQLEHFRLEQVP